MSELHRHLDDYLRLRRALGFKLAFHGHVLPSLIGYLEAAGAATITAELAVAWAGLPRDVLPITRAHRLGAARGFARYLKTIDPAAEIPPAGIWPSVTARPQPWIWAEAWCPCTRVSPASCGSTPLAGTGYAPARQQRGSSSPPSARRCALAALTTPSPSSPPHSGCARRHPVPGFMI